MEGKGDPLRVAWLIQEIRIRQMLYRQTPAGHHLARRHWLAQISVLAGEIRHLAGDRADRAAAEAADRPAA